MKIVLILLIAGCAGYTYANTIATSQEDVETVGYFQALAIDFMTPSAYSCPEANREKIKEEQYKAIQCVKNIRSNSSFCDTFVNHFKPCIQGIKEESKKCNDTNGVLLKNTILDSVIEEAKYLCGVDGEHIFELVNPCVLRSVQQSEDCRNNLTKPIEHDKQMTTICRTLPSVEKCFEDEMQKECKNDITKSTIHDVFNLDVKPCNVATAIYLNLVAYIPF